MNIVTLNEIISNEGIFIDGDWVESKDQDPSGSVRLIQLADVGDGVFLDKSKRYLTHKKAIELKCTFLEKGDVLLARMPDPIGRACIFPGSNTPCVTVVDVCIIRPKSNHILNEWLKYLINSPLFRQQITKYITGTTRQRISRGNLMKIEFTVPSIEEQMKVVTILDQANLLHQKRKHAIELLNEYLKSVFLEMFGVKTDSKIAKLESFAKSLKGSMRTGPFGSDLKHSEFVTEGIAVIGIDNAVKNKFEWKERRFITTEKYQKLKRYQVFPRDVIVTIMGTTGRSAVIPDDIPLAINTKHLAAITLDESKANPYFIAYSIHSDPRIQKQIIGNNRGAIMSGLNLGIIKNLQIEQQPVGLQNEFETIYKKVQSIKQTMLDQLVENEIRFQALMQRSFNRSL